MLSGNWIDLLIIIFVLMYFALNFKQGFIAELLATTGFLASLLVALLSFPILTPFYVNYFSLPYSFAKTFSFFSIWIVVEIIYFLLVKKILAMVSIGITFSRLNKYLVILPSLLSSLVLVGFVLTLLVIAPTPAVVKDQVFKSKVGGKLVGIFSLLNPSLEEALGQAINDSLAFLTIKPESREVIDLGFTVDKPEPDETAEIKVLNLINNERQLRGLSRLEFRDNLRFVARAHGMDMLERGYFSHISPEGKDVGGRLLENNISFVIAGENLALAQSEELAHQGLMDSPSHKANILSGFYSKVGIGIMDAGSNGKMVVEVFTN